MISSSDVSVAGRADAIGLTSEEYEALLADRAEGNRADVRGSLERNDPDWSRLLDRAVNAGVL